MFQPVEVYGYLCHCNLLCEIFDTFSYDEGTHARGMAT